MHNSMCYNCQRYKQLGPTRGTCNSFEWTTIPVGYCGAATADAAYPRLVRVPWKEGSLPNGSSNTTGTYPYTGSGSGGPTEGSEIPYCYACLAKRYTELTCKKPAFMARDHPVHSSGLFAQTFAPKRDTVDFAVSNWCNSQKRPTHIPVGSVKPPGVGNNPPDLNGMTATAAPHPPDMSNLGMTNAVGPPALASQMIRVMPTQITMPTVIPGPNQTNNWVCHTLPTTIFKSTNAATCDGIQSMHLNHSHVAHNTLQPCANLNTPGKLQLLSSSTIYRRLNYKFTTQKTSALTKNVFHLEGLNGTSALRYQISLVFQHNHQEKEAFRKRFFNISTQQTFEIKP